MDYIHHYDSPLGGITIASDGNALIGLWFDGQKYYADSLHNEYEEKALPIFEQTDQWLDTLSRRLVCGQLRSAKQSGMSC